MRVFRFILPVLVLSAMFAAGCDGTVGDRDGDNVRSETDKKELPRAPLDRKPEYMYALVGTSGSFSDTGTLVMKGLQDDAVYFAERPGRNSGTYTLDEFELIWNGRQMQESMSVDPPNALLSVRDGANSEIAVVEILAGKFAGKTATFRVVLLEGDIPNSFGACTLVIDALPTAVNGQITD